MLFAGTACADLYRWVDPETGSVKLSSTPPPWFDRQGSGPVVERIPAPNLPVAPKPVAVPRKPEAKK